MGTASHSGSSGIFPVMIYVQGSEQQTLSLNHTPFTVGRKVDRDLVIADPRVSREHASIVAENGEFTVVDQGSKHGTFVNGERVERHKLQRNDRLEFGARDVAYLIFHPLHTTSNTAREFLSQISGIDIVLSHQINVFPSVKTNRTWLRASVIAPFDAILRAGRDWTTDSSHVWSSGHHLPMSVTAALAAPYREME